MSTGAAVIRLGVNTAGRRHRPAVGGGDERQVGVAVRLDAAMDARRDEACRRGDAHWSPLQLEAAHEAARAQAGTNERSPLRGEYRKRTVLMVRSL